jgi:hypothetical protein
LPITTSIDRAGGLRTHKVTGDLLPEELTSVLDEVYSEPEHDPDMNVLWDLREASVASFTIKDVEALRDFVAPNWGTGGRSLAALVVSDDLQYGMSRMYEMLSESRTGGKIRVFRDMDEAVGWLSGGR